MSERLSPEAVRLAILNVGDPATYKEVIANPLWDTYSRNEINPDPEFDGQIVSITPCPLDMKDIDEIHIPNICIQIMVLGAHIIQDLKKAPLTHATLLERNRATFYLFGTLGILEATRRRNMGPLNSVALFRAIDMLYKEQFEEIFGNLPRAEKLGIFSQSFLNAYNLIHQHGFTVIGEG